MQVLQFLENAGKQLVHPFSTVGSGLLNTPEAISREIQNKPINDIQQRVFGTTNSGDIAKQIGGDIGQIGLTALAPGAGEAAAKAVGATGTIAKGAIGGASVGGAFNVAGGVSQGQTSPDKLTMNFLTGTAAGAALGASAGTVGSVAKTLFDKAKLQKMATSENTSQIEKDVQPVTGPVVAQKIAPAIAQSKDPEIVSNVIDNAVKEHLPTSPSPSPSVGTDITAPSVNEPVKLGEGSGQPIPVSTPDTTRSPELQAQEGMQNILNSGGTVDEALNHHMELTGSNMGEAQKSLSQVIGAVGTEKGQVNAKLNPEFGKLEIPTADTNERAILNSRMVRNQVTRAGNAALQEVDKLSKEDMSLLDQRGDPAQLVGQAKDKAQFLRAANAVKKYNDTTQALGAGQLEQDVPYRQNYGAPLKFDRSTPEGEQAYQNAVAKLPTTPGYGKGRFFQNYEDAAQISNGELKRQNENFLGDLHKDIQQRQNDLAQLTLAKGLNEANPGQVRIGQPGTTETGTDKQLLIPGGGKVFMPQPIAEEINKRAPAPLPTGGYKGYDELNSNLKSLKLAGGGFHSINVLGSYIGQQISSGKLFTPTGMRDLGDVIKTTFSQRAMNSELDRLSGQGTLINADASGLKYGRGETAADINPSGIGGKIPVLKQIHEGIFDRQIPLLKLKIFEQQTKGLDRNNPDDLRQMTSVAKGLNNAFGGLNREIQGLNPKQFQIAARGFLATDYNEGQLRTLANAFNPKADPAERKLAQQIVFGKALLFGGLSTAGGAAGGEFQGKDPKQVAFDILQKVAVPSFTIGENKVGLPTTQIAEVAKPIEQTVQGIKSGNALQGIQDFSSARLAAAPGAIEELGANKNFYGQTVWGKDKLGRPVSGGTTAADVASLFAPIPAAQSIQTATGKESLAAAAANVAGVRVTPKVNVQSLPAANQTILQQAKSAGVPDAQINAMTDFFGALRQNSKARSQAYIQAVTDLNKGDRQGAQTAIATYNQNLIKTLAPIVKRDQYVNQIMMEQLNSNTNNPVVASGVGLIMRLPSATTVKKDVVQNPTKYGLTIQ